MDSFTDSFGFLGILGDFYGYYGHFLRFSRYLTNFLRSFKDSWRFLAIL